MGFFKKIRMLHFFPSWLSDKLFSCLFLYFSQRLMNFADTNSSLIRKFQAKILSSTNFEDLISLKLDTNMLSQFWVRSTQFSLGTSSLFNYCKPLQLQRLQMEKYFLENHSSVLFSESPCGFSYWLMLAECKNRMFANIETSAFLVSPH